MSNVGRIRVHSVLERLKGLTSDLSGYDSAELDVASTFLDMGFDSLFLTQLATTFQREYGLKITFRQLFDELPTLRAQIGRASWRERVCQYVENSVVAE